MKTWIGTMSREEDDFGDKIEAVFVDGKTVHGPWAIMTPKSHRMHGVGFGNGRGQQYDKQDGKWVKTKG